MNEPMQVPEIVVREIGALHLQITMFQQRIGELETELAALKATKPDAPTPT